MFPPFLKKVADIIARKLNIIFLRLIRLGSFPEYWLSPNVTAIPKGAPSPDRENHRPISITPILSKVYEKLVSHKLSSFCEKYGLLPAAQFAYMKGLGCTAYHISSHSEVHGLLYRSARFSAAFDRVRHMQWSLQIEIY